MTQDMLGAVSVREAKGVVTDLLEKFGGKNGREWLTPSKRFLRREDPWSIAAKLNLRYDRRKDGLELREHASRTITSVADLELVPFLRDGEQSIRGYDLIGRTRYELDADLGQEDAEFLLEHKEEIPSEFSEFGLFCAGTIWSHGTGFSASGLILSGGLWYLASPRLELDFGSTVRLARLRRQ